MSATYVVRREASAGKLLFAEIEENEDELVKLRAWLRKIRQRDVLRARLGRDAEARVRLCARRLDGFTARVLEREGVAARPRRARQRA